MRFLRLCWFHFKLYSSNQYFLWLTISSTISLFFIQYITAFSTNNLSDLYIWLRSGIFGLWSSATTATGCIGFQRRQGTLKYILNNNIDDRISLMALIFPASLFGLLSFPIAYFLSVIFSVKHDNLNLYLLLLILLLWFSAYIMDTVIAVSFIQTVNAIVYEQLVFIPLLLLSGLFGYPHSDNSIFYIFQWLIPISTPIDAILNDHPLNYFSFLFSIFLWAIIGWNIVTKAIKKSKVSGNGGLI